MRIWWTSFLEKETTHFSPLEIEHFCSSLAEARPRFALQCRETWTKCNTHTQVDLLVFTQALTQFGPQQIKDTKGKRQNALLKEANMTFILENINLFINYIYRTLSLRHETTTSVRGKSLEDTNLIKTLYFSNCDIPLTLKKNKATQGLLN